MSLIVATGRSGSLGRSLPPDIVGLRTRLEESVDVMAAELNSLKPVALIHLAALTDTQESERDPTRARALNVDGARKWFLASQAAGVERFVFVSTSHVFQPRASLTKITAEMAPDAVSAYGRSKFEAERELTLLAAKGSTKVAIGRVFSVIGTLSNPLRSGYLHAELQRRARFRELSPIVGYKNVRDFLDVETIAERLEQLAKSKRDGVFHICSGRGTSVRELAEQVFAEARIADDDTAEMFPPNDERPNFLVGEPSQF